VLEELDALLAKTPSGIVDLFQLKGIGPKKNCTALERIRYRKY
jgi:DNA polymerase/3'-5' exonuclease PolX